MPNEQTLAAVRALDAERVAAMIAKDRATLERLLSADLVYTHSNALVDSKKSYIDGVVSLKFDYRKVDTSEVSQQVYGDTVITTGRAVIELAAAGKTRVLNNRFVHVWAKGPAGWQFVAWQSTPIPAPA